MYFTRFAVTTALIGLIFRVQPAEVAKATLTKKQCQEIEYVYSKYGCHKVIEPAEPLNWAEAREVCKKNEAELAVLDSEDELVFLAEIMKKHNRMVYAWLGVHAEEGEWMTVHGTSINVTGFNPWKDQDWSYWKPREDDCTILANIYSLGQSMTRHKCDLKIKGFICEK